MSAVDKLKSFCNKYIIRILDDTRRFAKIRPVENFSIPDNKDYYIHQMEAEYEPLLTITIPLSKLEALSNIDSVFYNNIEDVYARQIFESWMDSQREEKYLRQQYPAVQSAYEQYSMVLHLCREKPKKFKDFE